MDFELEPCVAINVAVCEDATADTFAVKLAFFAPDATVSEAGTETALLLLARLTTVPLVGAAAFRVTVQASAPAPTIDEFAQFSPDNEGVVLDPFPCSFTDPVRVTELLVIAFTLSWPVESVADLGSYLICTLKLPPAGTVAGRVPALAAKELSERLSCSTCMEDVPLFVISSVWLTLFPTLTSPKSTAVGFTASPPVVVLFEENGVEFEPQPETPKPSPRAAAAPNTRA